MQIKSRDGRILWEGEAASIKEAVEKAVLEGAFLEGASLSREEEAFEAGRKARPIEDIIADLAREVPAADWNGVWLNDVERLNEDLQAALNRLVEVSAAARDMAEKCIYRINGLVCPLECRGRAICPGGHNDLA